MHRLLTKLLDLTSSLEVGPATSYTAENGTSFCNARSMLTIAFQFPFESNLQVSVANMARQYIRSMMSSVQSVAMAISASGLSPTVRPNLSSGSPEALTLACWICQSYRYYVGVDLLREGSIHRESVLKTLWLHQDAILCCSLKTFPVFIFANQAGLDMLETTLVALRDATLTRSTMTLVASFPNFPRLCNRDMHICLAIYACRLWDAKHHMIKPSYGK